VSQTTFEAHLRPTVRCVPSADKVLHARAANALDLVRTAGSCERVAVRLESVLVAWYPHVKVVPIEPIATDHGEQAWYVYRDGHIA
jgi:hypothetical protein